jgi:hypothetical protein
MRRRIRLRPKSLGRGGGEHCKIGMLKYLKESGRLLCTINAFEGLGSRDVYQAFLQTLHLFVLSKHCFGAYINPHRSLFLFLSFFLSISTTPFPKYVNFFTQNKRSSA